MTESVTLLVNTIAPYQRSGGVNALMADEDVHTPTDPPLRWSWATSRHVTFSECNEAISRQCLTKAGTTFGAPWAGSSELVEAVWHMNRGFTESLNRDPTIFVTTQMVAVGVWGEMWSRNHRQVVVGQCRGAMQKFYSDIPAPEIPRSSWVAHSVGSKINTQWWTQTWRNPQTPAGQDGYVLRPTFLLSMTGYFLW